MPMRLFTTFVIIFLIILISSFSIAQDLIPYRKGNHWGYVDKNKKIVVVPKFEQTQPFENGRGAVMINQKWGYVDATGKLVVACRFESASPYFILNDSLQAVVKLEDKWINIDQLGRPKALKFPPEKVVPEETGFVNYQTFEKDGLFGMTRYKDYYEKGHYIFGWDTLFQPKYAVLREGSHGKFIARNKKDKYGIITPTDSIIVPFNYDDINYIADDRTFYLRKGSNFGAVNTAGVTVVEVKFKSVTHHSNGLFKVDLQNGKSGYIFNGQEYWEELPPPGSVPAKPVSAPATPGKK
jgi:hypothetical protein